MWIATRKGNAGLYVHANPRRMASMKAPMPFPVRPYHRFTKCCDQLISHGWLHGYIILIVILASCNSIPAATPIQNPVAISPEGCLSEQTISPCFYRREKARKNESIIIFVHGIFGTSADTWGTAGNTWPHLVEGDDSFKDFDIALFSYHSTYFTSAQMIHEIAIRQLDILKDSPEFEQYKEIYFIAHSMGGLVVKSLLTHLNQGNDVAILRRVKAVIYLGTPSHGSILALIGSKVSRNPQLQDMTPIDQNAWLSDLDKYWNQLLNGRIESPYPRAYCAYEKENYSVTGRLIVSQADAASRCDDLAVGLPFDHSDLATPTSRYHDPYVWVMQKILKTSRAVTDQNKLTAPVPSEPEEIPIYIQCEGKRFPKTNPVDGELKGLVFYSETPIQDSRMALEFQNIGMPGSPQDWPDFRGRDAMQCQLTNYGAVPVLNIRITFGFRFRDTVWLDSKGSFSHGPTKLSGGWTSLIRKLDAWPNDRFVFYIKNGSTAWLEVSMPEFVVMHPLGKPKSRQVPLLRPDNEPGQLGSYYNSVFSFPPVNFAQQKRPENWPQNPSVDLPQR